MLDRFFMSCLLIFLGSVTVGQELVPRNELFKQPYERSFNPSHSGEFAFWLEAGQGKNNLIVLDLVKQSKQSFEQDKRLFQAVPFYENEALLLQAEKAGPLMELNIINLKSGESENIRKAGRIQIRHFTPEGVILSELKAPRTPPEYVFIGFDQKVKKLGTFPELDDLFFSRNLEPIAARRSHEDGSSELLYRKNDQWKVLQKYSWNEGVFLGGLQKVLSVSADGDKIYYTSNHESDKNRLYEFDVESEKSEELARSANTDILPMGALLDENYKPIYAVSIFAKSQYHVVQDWFKEHLEHIRKEVGPDISVVDPMWEAGIIMFRQFTGASNRYFVYHLENKEITFVHEENAWLSAYEFADRAAHSFTTSDGFELPMHIYFPKGADQDQDGFPDKPLPTVMYVHGGPWVGLIHFNNWFHTRNFQLLANRGYAVVVGEFRGTTGLGEKIVKASYKEWGGAMARDKKELAEWLLKHKVAKKDKIGIWGWSYGGFAAMAGLGLYPDTYACGISMYGPASIVPEEGNTGYGDPFWEMQVGEPDKPKDMEMLKKTSPINLVEKIEKPLLMTTGSKDQKISQKYNDLMAESMHELGKEITYFYYPEEVHDYREPESWVSFWAFAEEFLAKHLGGKVEPVEKGKSVGNYELVFYQGTKVEE